METVCSHMSHTDIANVHTFVRSKIFVHNLLYAFPGLDLELWKNSRSLKGRAIFD